MTSYLLVVNPKSGRGRSLARAETLRSRLALGHDVHVLETRARGFAADAVAERVRDFERVLAIGGDGTLNEVLSGLVRERSHAAELPALGFLASGTANVATRAFGLTSDPETLARRLPDAEERAVDIGLASHAGGVRPFLLWFGAGYDAVVIDALNRHRTGLMGIAGLLRRSPGVARAVHGYSAPEITIRTGTEAVQSGASVFLSNVAEMAFGGTAADTADPFDGRLDLLAVPRRSTVGVGMLWLRTMTSGLHAAPGVRHETTTHVTLEAAGDVPFQIDGEAAGRLPAEVRIEPGAVRLLMT